MLTKACKKIDDGPSMLVQHFTIMDCPYLYVGHTEVGEKARAIECQSKQRNMLY